MYVDVVKYREIVECFRAQEDRRRPIIAAASRATGLDFRTLQKGWEQGWPASRKRPALPPIRSHFPPASPAGTLPEPGPTHDASAAGPAPGAYSFVGSSGSSVASGPSIPSGPSIASGSSVASDAPTASAAAIAPTPGATDTFAAELASLSANRNVVKGILATAAPMLKILHEGTPKMKTALLSLITEQPVVAVRLLGELAKTIEISVRSSERLIQAQRVLDGTPNQTVRIEHATAPPPRLSNEELEAEVRRVRDAVERLARDDEAIDVPATITEQGGAS